MQKFFIGAVISGLLTFSSTAQAQMAASFRWCSGSPEFTINNVPKGTTELDFRMIDLWVPGYPHGGGRVAYKNQKKIACGSLQGSYVGPSPPPPQIHDYQWTIRALDSSGAVLGTAQTTRKFPE